jgi:nucleotide-binding universal stress UspA family protein
MSAPTIVVHVDLADALECRAEVAARLAREWNCRIIAVCATGLVHLGPSLSPGQATDTYRAAVAAMQHFGDLMVRHGIVAVCRHLSNTNAATALARAAQGASLVIMSHRANEATPPGHLDLCEFVVLNTSCPVLIVGARAQFGSNVIVAYDGSNAAFHALTQARPFLEPAQRVTLATFGPSRTASPVALDNAIDYLKSVGIAPTVCSDNGGDDVGRRLAALARNRHADMVVMGGSAHPRWRNVLRGGTTGFMLEHTDIALLMSH